MGEKNLDEKIEGRTDQAVGAAKEDLGKTTGNEGLEREGRAQQAEGEIREGVADAERAVDNAASDARNALDGE